MQLKKATQNYLALKTELPSYAVYSSCSKYLTVTINLSTIDISGDLLTSEKKKRIRKTKDLFNKVAFNLRKKSQNTNAFTLNMLKSVLRSVEDDTGMVFWKAYEVRQETKDITIIDVDFAKDFINDAHDVYDGLSDRLKTVWEISAVMLTTCLRFGDAKSLDESNFMDNRVVIKNQKTGTVTACPIPSALFLKLRKNLDEKGQVYTEDISKDSCYRAFPVLFYHYDEMKKEINGVPMYEAVKFHVFRKSAISIMLANGVPQSIVMAASGHAVGSKAFQRYVTNVEKLFSKEITNFNDNFYGS